MIVAGMNLSDIAYEVCTALEQVHTLAVLVGGSAAAFHAPEASMTQDLDFVLPDELFGISAAGIQALKALGFYSTATKGTLAHPATKYTLEILNGPLAVGAETINEWESNHVGDRVLHVISATVSVKDRLAHAIHFQDLSAASQAALIAKLKEVNLQDVRRWCKDEGGEKVFERFKILLET